MSCFIFAEITPQHVFALDFEQNPLDIKADYGMMVYAEPVEVVYNEVSGVFCSYS